MDWQPREEAEKRESQQKKKYVANVVKKNQYHNTM